MSKKIEFFSKKVLTNRFYSAIIAKQLHRTLQRNRKVGIAAMAQLVERVLGKDEVPGPNPGSSSKKSIAIAMDFFICVRTVRKANCDTTSFACLHAISFDRRSTSFRRRRTQMNEVALRANDVLRNDVTALP